MVGIMIIIILSTKQNFKFKSIIEKTHIKSLYGIYCKFLNIEEIDEEEVAVKSPE